MKKRNDTFSHAVVGLFMVALVALLAYFTIVVSGVDLLSGRNHRRISISFTNVGGLKEHDNVMFRGTKVGTVETIDVSPSNLVVTAAIDDRVKLRSGCRASVCSLSLLGGSYLMLEEGDGVPLAGEGVTLVGEEPSDWMSDVARIAKNIRELTEKLEIEGIVTNLEAASESVKNVLAKIENGDGLVGKLISSDDNIYDDIKESMSNIRSVTGMLNRTNLYENLETTIANAREISEKLNRQELFNELDGAIADFRKMCGSIDAAAGRFDLGKLDFKETTDKANDLLDNLNEVALRLKRGEGTLGKLSADDTLYKEIEGLVRDVRQTIDNYRDTTPISTFSSLATGAF